MTEKRKTGVGPGVNPRVKRRANLARLQEFIDQCRRGEATLPSRGLKVNYVELSRKLFGTSGSIKPENRAMREIVEVYLADNPVFYAGRNKETRAKAAATGRLNMSVPAPVQHWTDEEQQVIQGRLIEYLNQCRRGEATLYRSVDKPAYKAIAKHLFKREVRLNRSSLKLLIDECFTEVYGLRGGLEAPFEVSQSTVVMEGTVPVNTSSCALGLCPWDAGRFYTEMQEVEEAISSAYEIPAIYLEGFNAWRNVRTVEEFVTWLQRMLQTNVFQGTALASLQTFLLCELRHRSLALLPMGLVANTLSKSFPLSLTPRIQDRFTKFEQRLARDLAGRGQKLFAFLVCMGPVGRLEDFPLRQYVEMLRNTMEPFSGVDQEHRNFLGQLRRFATALDSAALEVGKPYSPMARVQLERLTVEVRWRHRGRLGDPLLLPTHPVVLEWGKAFRSYVDSRHWKTPEGRVQQFRIMLLFLETCDSPPSIREPRLREEWFGPEARLLSWLEQNSTEFGTIRVLSTLLGFFIWFGEQHQGFVSPLRKSDIPHQSNRPAKTTKSLIPRTILDEAKGICRELLKLAFAERTEVPEAFHCAKLFDLLLVCRLPVPGLGFAPHLVPVLPAILLTLLTLPIRSIQARFLDSGEADAEYPVIKAGNGPLCERIVWQRNESSLVMPKRREGWLRRIHDGSTWRNYLGFWVNTNKTAAVARSDARDFGFEIPWQHEELIGILLALREWQETHNPINKLTSRADLSEKALRPSAALAKRMPSYAYLFRHPREGSLTTWHEPAQYDAVSAFFLAVVEEVEARRRGTPNEVQLILTRDRLGKPTSAEFTLHGLRVAGITAFAEAGVPAPIIAEFLAGHMTVLMTVYYQKFGPASVTRMLDEALSALDRNRLADALAGQHDDQHLREMFVSGAADALATAADVQPGLWAIKLDGICPNGQTMCAQGGARDKSSMYGPVPGGARNCPLCRFWMTGPAFIAGQAISLNAQFYKLREKSEELVSLHARLRTLGLQDPKRDSLEHSIDAVEAEIDLMIHTLQARYRLVMASLQLDEGHVADGSKQALELVTPGTADDVKASLTEVSNYRMLDFLSRSVEVFPELDCRAATFKRNLFLDQLLDKEGFDAMFFRLPTEIANRAGNALGQLLSNLAGDEVLDSIADGTRTLRSLGVDEIEGRLSAVLGQPIRFVPKSISSETFLGLPTVAS